MVKNGSNALATTSGVMPAPVSLTASETYSPGGRSSRAPALSMRRFSVSTVMRPPSGIASRALMHRLSRAFSSWLWSTSVPHSPGEATKPTSIAGPTVRRTSSSIPATRRLTSVACGESVWRRENASSRCVSAAARRAAPSAASR